jgi:zinc/manganese transport system substrate-binding protein
MRHKVTTLLAFTIAVLASTTADAELRIVTSTSDLAAVVREIGGEHATVKALALHTQDPHWVDARPHLALDLARADMLVIVGMDLEIGWLPTLQTGSRNARIQPGGHGFVDASELIEPLEVPTKRVDRSEGDVHPGGNPHYMFDPRAAIRVARGLAERMAALDPDQADCYRNHAKAFAKRLETARPAWEAQLKILRGANVIAYHKSFPYLADWLGFRVVEHIEPRPGIPPNPHHVARVLGAAKTHGVRVILQESFYPDRTGQLVASRTSAKLARIPAGPDLAAGQGYVDFIDHVVATLRAAL